MARTESASHWIRLVPFLLMSAFAVPASAATDIHVDKTALLNVSPEHVLEVLASRKICDSGC